MKDAHLLVLNIDTKYLAGCLLRERLMSRPVFILCSVNVSGLDRFAVNLPNL